MLLKGFVLWTFKRRGQPISVVVRWQRLGAGFNERGFLAVLVLNQPGAQPIGVGQHIQHRLLER